MEIERKFLIKKNAFNLDNFDYVEIQQGYISTSPVIRIRKRTSANSEEYILTVKSKGMLSRQEYELSLEADDYKGLLNKVEGNVITKRRYLIPLDNGLTLELDYFKDLFHGLVMGEIEFTSEAEANKYNLPDFVIREVTFDKRYHNSNMSIMPKEEILDLITLSH